MNKQLSEAIARIRALPEERQQEAAALLQDFLSQESEEIELTPEQIAEIERRLDDDDIASDEEVKAFFDHFKK
jgi:vacuolar-type H+-ATPase subunit H